MNKRNFLAMTGMMMSLASYADPLYRPTIKVRFSDKSIALFREPKRS